MKNIVGLKESDLVRLVKKVLNEQAPISSAPQQSRGPMPGAPQQSRFDQRLARQATRNPGVAQTPAPAKNPVKKGGGQYGPYCKIGTSQGIIKQHTTARSGPDASLGETGFGLFDAAGKLICKISTKYTQGGYVAKPS